MKLIQSIFVFILLILFGCQNGTTSESKTGNAIPYPNQEWQGKQGKTLADSKPDFIGQPQAPEDAPNVLIVMLDDAGYSNASSFGGVMKTLLSTG
jgi:hypothetical protein